jgi:long-chain acyl-CoA synthetase
MNIVDLIAKESKKYLKNTAIIDGKRSISYAELVESLHSLSLKLKELGISPFMRVALLSGECADYIIISLAVLKLNAVIVPVPYGSSEEEISSLLDRIKVNFIIFEQGAYFKDIRSKPIKNPKVKKEFFIRQFKPREDLPRNFYRLNPAFIRFSSGTTGPNKGVLLSHKSIIERTEAADRGLRVSSSDKIIWVLSMSFHFVVTILLFLRRGATIILSSGAFPYELLNNLKKYQATFIYASPMHYNILTSLNLPKRLLSNLRLAVSTAVKLPDALAEKFYHKFGFNLTEAYGIIEVGLPFVNLSRRKSKRGSVGQALKGYNLRITHKDKNGVGRVLIKGKGMLDAYISPWRNRRGILIKGWFDTGDLGRLDKDGFLFITGREKNVINFSGMKIFPFEVESVLNKYPSVKESYVYGLAHLEYGQVPMAKVILKGKNEFNLDSLRRFCYQHLASYKVPKEFEVIGELPKTASGKIKAL